MAEQKMFEKFNLQNASGLLFDPSVTSAENITSVQQMELFDDDVIAVAYPKCGITWTQYIIWEILNGGVEPPSLMDMTMKIFPFMEIVGAGVTKDMARPRTLKYHSPANLTPKNPNAKYIIIFRNPFDCCVSYFHHLKQRYDISLGLKMTFDAFFECFITGQIGFGDYFDFVLTWYERRNDPNVLILFYEEMKKDHEGAALKIADFLGTKYSAEIRENPELLAKVLHYSSFSYMKGNLPLKTFVFNETTKAQAAPPSEKKIEFFRKGEVGDWKTLFSEEQKKRLMDKFNQKLSGTSIKDKLMPPV